MPFNSVTFITFFILVFTLYKQLPHRAQNIFLLIASYVFYAWWSLPFLFLIIISTILDYVCGLMIGEGCIPKIKRHVIASWLVLSAFFLIVIQWNNINAAQSSQKPLFSRLFSDKSAWCILLATVLIILAFNLLYDIFVRLTIPNRQRLFLILSIAGNLSILCAFKYLNFFIDNLQPILHALGFDSNRLHLQIVLPVGLSFYIFMTMSYTIDIYRRRLIPTKHIHEYALFVAFFPKLLAGPIERAVAFLPQITKKRDLTTDKVMYGLQQTLYGFFKKVVIADGVAATVSSVFGHTYQLSWTDATLGSFLFTIQIYCDFSGYSDIAIGTARILGFDLMTNFNFPYFSRNPSEFWGRWHISLSSWFRDYVFFPLGGPYGSPSRWMRNVLVTFLLVGFWHGAAWNYILWGLYHGILLCLHRIKVSLRSSKRRPQHLLSKSLTTLAFFVLINFSWILFRSSSPSQIADIVRPLFHDIGNLKLNVALPTKAALLGFPIFLFMEFLGNSARGKRIDQIIPLPIWTALDAAMLFIILLALANVPSGFIYFQF